MFSTTMSQSLCSDKEEIPRAAPTPVWIQELTLGSSLASLYQAATRFHPVTQQEEYQLGVL